MSAPPSVAKRPSRPPFVTRKMLWAIAMLVAIASSFYTASQGPSALINWDGFAQFREFWWASLTPDLTPEFLGIMGRATFVTFAYAVCGTTLSLGFGFIGGLLLSETWWRTVLPPTAKGNWLGPLIWRLMRLLLAFPRAIHELIWGLFFLSILGLDPVVAVVAIAIPFSAIVAKVFAEILDTTPQEPLNALLNSGVSPATAWLYGLLPQAFPNLLSYASYRFECALRSAAVLGVIGAGGLGYEIFLSLQSLQYRQLWTGFYALILLNGIVDGWSAWMRQTMGFTSRLDLQNRRKLTNKANRSVPPPHPSHRWLFLSWGLITLAIPLCFWELRIDWGRLWSPRTHRLLQEILSDSTPTWPSFSSLQALLHLSSLTLAMSILAAALAGAGGILLSFPAAQPLLLPGGWLYPRGETKPSLCAKGLFLSSRLLLLGSRAIPAPIWALVLLFVLFPGVWPGALALAVHNCGILGRLMAEVNENLDDRPVRSLQTLGASPGQIILYGVLPQNLSRFMAYIFYRWEVCIRETVIVGLVGAGGLGRLMTEQLSSFDYSGLTLTLGCFVLLTFLVDVVSQKFRWVQDDTQSSQ